MDLSTLPVPAFTALDAVTQAVSAICYLAIGLAAWLRSPRDIRTQVFLAFSLANITVFAIPTISWMRGIDPARLSRTATAAVLSALGVAALLLFHVTQVFPRRRPWIRSAGIQMILAYAMIPLVVVGLIWYQPENLAALSVPYVVAFLVFGFPLLVLLGFVLPVTAIVSLVRSYQESERNGLASLKRPILWILISQIAGGTLAVVFAPVLAVLAPNSAVQAVLRVIISTLGLLTPLAFAAAVWKYDVLAVSPD